MKIMSTLKLVKGEEIPPEEGSSRKVAEERCFLHEFFKLFW
jgi:hypothetical protein